MALGAPGMGRRVRRSVAAGMDIDGGDTQRFLKRRRRGDGGATPPSPALAGHLRVLRECAVDHGAYCKPCAAGFVGLGRWPCIRWYQVRTGAGGYGLFRKSRRSGLSRSCPDARRQPAKRFTPNRGRSLSSDFLSDITISRCKLPVTLFAYCCSDSQTNGVSDGRIRSVRSRSEKGPAHDSRTYQRRIRI